MRRPLLLLAAFSMISVSAGEAYAQSMSVGVDRAARIALGGTARDVVVGNPGIADVTVLDSRNLVILGKAPGVTNLIVVDARGRTLVDREIVVTTDGDSRVSYFRGATVQTYACSPRCERAGNVDSASSGAATPAAQ